MWGTGPEFGVERDGAHAEFAVVPMSWLSEKPKNLSMPEATAVGIPYFAAYVALQKAAELQPGEHVLITGVNGAVGTAATQIAHWRKATVIGADVQATGSGDQYINLQEADLVSNIHRLTDGKGVDVILDAVGSQLFEPCLRCLSVGGRQVAIAGKTGERVTFELAAFLHHKARLIGVSTIDMDGAELAPLLDELRPLFEAGHLRVPLIEVSEFAAALSSYAKVASRAGHAVQVLKIV